MLRWVLISTLILTFALGESARADHEPFDIVVFLTDDQRFDTMWAMPIVQNRLGTRGVTFTNAVVTTPVCCPFRGSFLGGGYLAHNTGVLENSGDNGGFPRFVDTNSLSLDLQGNGYQTFLVGKYLNGYISAVQQIGAYIPPGWSRFVGWAGGGPFAGTMTFGATGATSTTGTILPPWTGFQEEAWRDHAMQFLDDFPRTGGPRFVYLESFVPHFPSTPAPGDEALFPTFEYRDRAWNEQDLSDKPSYVVARASPYDTVRFANQAEQDEFTRDMLRSLQVMDRVVGTVFDRIQAEGNLDHTVFIFASDNGYMWGEHGLHTKGLPYEEAIRVPLIVVVPGIPARSDDSLVSVDLDLPALIYDLAGLPAPGDGLSLLPLLQNPAAPWRENLLFEQSGEEFAGIRHKSAVDGSEWKYVRYLRGRTETELYDLSNDPFELESLHADPAQQSRIQAFDALLDQEIGLHLNEPTFPPVAYFGMPYSRQLSTVGGAAPYLFEIVEGAPPAGITLSPTGLLSGSPTEVVSQATFKIKLSSAALASQSGVPQQHIRQMKLTVIEGDIDGDGALDGSDVCPFLSNPGQEDADGDGVGDICDIPCDDGLDNDADLLIDLADPGCLHPYHFSESPRCNDGIDNDENGFTDLADPRCSESWQNSEGSRGCGSGAELVPLLLGLAAWRRRKLSRPERAGLA